MIASTLEVPYDTCTFKLNSILLADSVKGIRSLLIQQNWYFATAGEKYEPVIVVICQI